jgi:ADP-ribose pyrophosphatase YjhB (NUDIX family)
MQERTYPIIPIPAVGAIVAGSKGLLLVLRNKNPASGQWSVPGGIIKTGETQKEALSREVLEETSIQIDLLEMITAADVILRDSDGNVEYHFIWILYLAKALTDDIHFESPEVEARWFPLDGLPSDEMPPEVLDLILNLSERIKQIQNKVSKSSL